MTCTTLDMICILLIISYELFCGCTLANFQHLQIVLGHVLSGTQQFLWHRLLY